MAPKFNGFECICKPLNFGAFERWLQSLDRIDIWPGSNAH